MRGLFAAFFYEHEGRALTVEELLTLEDGHMWDWGAELGDEFVNDEWVRVICGMLDLMNLPMCEDGTGTYVVGLWTDMPMCVFNRLLVEDGTYDLVWEPIGLRLDMLFSLS